MCLRFYVLFFSITYVAYSQWPYNNIKDMMGKFEKNKIRRMARELVVEAQNMITQVDRVRDEYYAARPFEVGMLMGQIREKYKSMLELYRMTYNKFTNKSNLLLHGVAERRVLHYIVRMESIRAIEIDIDQLVRILESSGKGNPHMNILELIKSAKTKKPSLRSYLPFDGFNMQFRRSQNNTYDTEPHQESDCRISMADNVTICN